MRWEATLLLKVHIALNFALLRHNLVEAEEWWRHLMVVPDRVLVADVPDVLPWHSMESNVLVLAEVHPRTVHLLASNPRVQLIRLG